MQQLLLKQRKYTLLVAVVVLLTISYRLAMKNTIEAWQLNRQLHKQLTQQNGAGYQPQYTKKDIYALNKIIGLYQADTVTYKTILINTLSAIAEKEHVKISQLPPPDPAYQTDRIHIQAVEFKDDYFALQKVLYDLEQTRGIGIPRSLSITAEKGLGERNDLYLKLSVFLETVK